MNNIKICKSSVFGAGADCIVNTVNCIGAMGKGLALEFSLRYPKLDKIYVDQCAKKFIRTGHVYFYEINKQKIINFPTKFHFAHPSKIEWIVQGLDDFVKQYKKFKIKSIAFPLLGCTNGGLDKKEVIEIMKDKLSQIDIPVYICLSEIPDEVEARMIDAYNSYIKKNNLLAELGIRSKKIKLVPVRRFYQINNLDGVGESAYSKIHKFFLNKEYDKISLI